MSVNSVEGNNSNIGLITAGSAIAGGSAGALAGYYSKPWLKDGAPTDTFVKKVGENIINSLPQDQKNQYNEAKTLKKAIDNAKSVDELKNIFRNSKLLKQGYGALDITIEEVLKDFDGKTVEQIKDEIKTGFLSVEDMFGSLDSNVKDLFKEIYNKDTKKLVFDKDVITDKGFEAFKKAANNMQGKSAAIWGAVGAAALGIGGYITASAFGRKQPDKQKENDTQA